MLLYLFHLHMTAVLLNSSLRTMHGAKFTLFRRDVAHFEPRVNPQRGNVGIHAHLQVAFSVCKCVCCECCGLRLRRRDRVRVFIFQNNLSCFVAHSHSPRSDFFLNDGVETGDIFEVFSQSVFLRRNGGNSIFGFEMANMSCKNTYFTNTHFTTRAGFTI